MLNPLSDAQIGETLPKNTIVLNKKNNTGKVYLIGTAHVSDHSAQDVKTLIKMVKPKWVFLELCKSRISLLDTAGMNRLSDTIKSIKTDYSTDLKAQTDRINALDIESFYTEDKEEQISLYEKLFVHKLSIGTILFTALYNFALKNFKSKPGVDMKSAAFEGMRQGASLALGDRPISITLARVIHELPLWSKIRLIIELIRMGFLTFEDEEVEIIKDYDVVDMVMETFEKKFPSLIRVLITERDMYMSKTLKLCKDGDVVAVMGTAHLKGIQKYWDQDIDICPLIEGPKKAKNKKKWFIIVAAFAIAISCVIYAFV